MVSHHVGESIRDIPALNDLLCLVCLICELVRELFEQLFQKVVKRLTNKKEKMIQPKNNHFPILKGMATQPLCRSGEQLLKMALDQESVDNMVTAVKISDM